MPFYWLADSTIPAIELHCAFNFESGWVVCIARYTNEDEPFLIGRDTVVDNLGAGDGGMAIEYFLRWGRLVCDGPVGWIGTDSEDSEDNSDVAKGEKSLSNFGLTSTSMSELFGASGICDISAAEP